MKFNSFEDFHHRFMYKYYRTCLLYNAFFIKPLPTPSNKICSYLDSCNNKFMFIFVNFCVRHGVPGAASIAVLRANLLNHDIGIKERNTLNVITSLLLKLSNKKMYIPSRLFSTHTSYVC